MKITIYKCEDMGNHIRCINTETGEVFDDLYPQLYRLSVYVSDAKSIPLNKCQACYKNVDGIYSLKSYSTIVAIYKDEILYDCLRTEYGYTKPSAMHIRKFADIVKPIEIIRMVWA